ncbi:MAG: alpha/beta fold hydrolase [Firmicutes bacterium]|nr:alpha/beta fold hydrolase [Bacillota bacterium]
MDSFQLKKQNGAAVPGLSLVPDGVRDIIIMVHGFGSSRDCMTAQMLFRRMPPAGFGVVTYDQPGHGSGEARAESLRLENCFASLAAVEQYVSETWPDCRIHYFSSSFGAYVTTLYVCSYPHKGCDAFLRSAAVNMPLLLLGPPGSGIDPVYMKEFEEKGYIVPDVGAPDAVRIPFGFLEDLREHDLSRKFAGRIFNDVRFEMVHGEKDSTIELSYAKSFAEQFNIPITVIPGEEHTLSDFPETPDRVADLAIAFYRAGI